jgi:hypothetical protein
VLFLWRIKQIGYVAAPEISVRVLLVQEIDAMVTRFTSVIQFVKNEI